MTPMDSVAVRSGQAPRPIRLLDTLCTCPRCGALDYHLLGDRDAYRTVEVIGRECRDCRATWWEWTEPDQTVVNPCEPPIPVERPAVYLSHGARLVELHSFQVRGPVAAFTVDGQWAAGLACTPPRMAVMVLGHEVPIAPANVVNPRIDLIVSSDRQWEPYVLTGVPAVSPVRPACAPDELPIVAVHVRPNVTAVYARDLVYVRSVTLPHGVT